MKTSLKNLIALSTVALLAACKPMPMEERSGPMMDLVEVHRQLGFWEIVVVRQEATPLSDFELWALDTYTEQRWLLHGSVGYSQSPDYRTPAYDRRDLRRPYVTYASPNGRQMYFLAAGEPSAEGKLAERGSLWVTDGSPSGTRMVIDFSQLVGINVDEYVDLRSVQENSVYLKAVRQGCVAEPTSAACAVWVRVDLSNGNQQTILMPYPTQRLDILTEEGSMVYASELYSQDQPSRRGYYAYDLQAQQWLGVGASAGKNQFEVRRDDTVATYFVRAADLPRPQLRRLDLATGQDEQLALPREDVTWMNLVENDVFVGDRFGIFQVALEDGRAQLWQVDEFGQVVLLMEDARDIYDIVVGEDGGLWSNNRRLETSYWLPPYDEPVVSFESGHVSLYHLVSVGNGRYATQVERGTVAGDARAAIIDPVRQLIEPIVDAPDATRSYRIRRFEHRENYVLHRATVGDISPSLEHYELRYHDMSYAD